MQTTKNHLGNIRVNYTLEKGSLVILDEQHYYPFGLEHGKYNPDKKEFRKQEEGGGDDLVVITEVANSGYQYKYNGKELQDELGLNEYDLGARGHDPARVQFGSIDPRAEDYYSQSPYVFAANNPVFFIDINGEGIDTKYVTESGDLIADIDDGSDAVFVVENGNETDLIIDLIQENVTNDNQDADTNAEIGEKYGYNLENHLDNVDKGLKMQYGRYGSGNSHREVLFQLGYSEGYSGENAVTNFGNSFYKGSSSIGYGKGRGVSHKGLNRMHAYEPQIKGGKPKYDFGSMIGNARNSSVKAQSVGSNYTIQRGDTLTGIANSNNTTVSSLANLNSIKNIHHIEIGQQIKIK